MQQGRRKSLLNVVDDVMQQPTDMHIDICANCLCSTSRFFFFSPARSDVALRFGHYCYHCLLLCLCHGPTHYMTMAGTIFGGIRSLVTLKRFEPKAYTLQDWLGLNCHRLPSELGFVTDRIYIGRIYIGRIYTRQDLHKTGYRQAMQMQVSSMVTSSCACQSSSHCEVPRTCPGI